MRLVRYRTTDLTRLALVTRIVDRVVRGEMDVETADATLAGEKSPKGGAGKDDAGKVKPKAKPVQAETAKAKPAKAKAP